MAQRTDYKTLQRLSVGESENNRAARVNRLVRSPPHAPPGAPCRPG